MANDQENQRVLSNIDPAKRQFIGTLIGTTAFVAPLVASFAMDSINTSAVATTTSNVKPD